MLKKLIVAAVAAAVAAGAWAGNPKREFRGAWLHTVHQGQYAALTTPQIQAKLRAELDSLQAVGCNAILFQVRPSADAFYPSKLEPWSRFLTKNGAAPAPYWDPLQFMIDESHARGMELHAWLNPYRVTTSPNEKLAPGHLYYKEPERFVTYTGDKKMYFDPGLPQNRAFIEDVVVDIVNRYDVDGIHFDDYFYPYPAAGHEFPDSASYAKYGNGMDRGDWRRKNVDLLIEGLHNRIAAVKPWVRFGISPFGVWRNKSTDPRGSETNALQNYDALFADVLLWAQKGWIDYQLPQLYWQLEHPRASTMVLAKWWNDNAFGRHMYFGQDVDNIMKHKALPPYNSPTQLAQKIDLSRSLPNVQGNCWWPGYSITRNRGGVADSLANDRQSTIALVPEYPWIENHAPAAPAVKGGKGQLTITAAPAAGTASDASHYVVYRAENGIDDPAAIVRVVYGNKVALKPGKYVVTALNRVNAESKPSAVVTVK